MPLLGLGTFLLKPGKVGLAVKTGIALGYRHIDCATVYGHQEEIRNALKEVFDEGKVKHEEIFITSKVPSGNMHPNNVLEQAKPKPSVCQISQPS